VKGWQKKFSLKKLFWYENISHDRFTNDRMFVRWIKNDSYNKFFFLEGENPVWFEGRMEVTIKMKKWLQFVDYGFESKRVK